MAKYEPLTRDQVRGAVRGNSSDRPPTGMVKWPGEGLRELHGDAVQEILDRYPDDVVWCNVVQPGQWNMPEDFPPEYRWQFRDPEETEEKVGRDAGARVINDWSDLDPFLEHLAHLRDLVEGGLPVFEPVRRAVEESDGRYVAARAWGFFYERLWMLRGMQNVLLDFHAHPDEMHRLCEGLLEFALVLAEGVADAGADAFSTSNDLGHQTGLMMSPKTFREFLKPRLGAIAETCRRRDMDYWIHSCGNLIEILPDMAEIGVSCLHPLQYGAMDWEESARLIEGRMTAWAGADVQHIIPDGTPEQVREHLRHLVDTFYRPGRGRLVVAAGNGICPPTTLENLDAFLDETFRYGLEVARG